MSDASSSALPPMTLQEKRQVVIKLLSYPALSVQLFLRRKIGLRCLKPLELMITTTAVVVGSPIMGFVKSVAVPHTMFGPPANVRFFDLPTEIFALAVIVTGLLRRHSRWRELCRGERWHTYCRGVSYLASILPFPETIVQRFIDPLACLAGGVIVAMLLSAQLGGWLVFSGFALLMIEQYDYEQTIDRELDMLDSLTASEQRAETLQMFAGGEGAVSPPRLDATAGIPTGPEPALREQILRRQRRGQTCEA